MSKKLLSCGGLYIDDETITETDGILSASSGGELPEVTAADNGDVLTVVSGAWAKAAPSGGVMIVEMDVDIETNIYTLRSTWQEVADAISSGMPVFAKFIFPEGAPGSALTFICQTFIDNSQYYVRGIDFNFPDNLGLFYLVTNSPNGYPVSYTG